MNEKEARINLDFTLSRESRHEPSVVKRRATAVTLEHCCICSHSNHKRCLAMAEKCKARYDAEDAKVNGCGVSWEYISKEMKYWERWQWRWEELAEEPTWAKFLQLIHKEAK